MPSTSTTLFFEELPWIILIEVFLMPSSSERIFISSSFAAPPTGAELTLTLRVSSIIPEMPFLDDLGSTFIFIVTPFLDFLKGILMTRLMLPQ